MDKINVLWIEDNPLQESLYVEDLVKRDAGLSAVFTKDLHEYMVPAIHFDKELAAYHQYFNLQVLQHPLEIKDYVTMCLRLEDEKGIVAFRDMDGVLPEVIAFDYQFGATITINQGKGALSYHSKLEAIRKFINPNFKFKIHFPELFDKIRFILEESASENYSEIDFLKAISKTDSVQEIKKKDRDELAEDDFGLFSAIEILRIFREHVTVAIPATYNKNETERLSLHGKYFEWLNEYDYSVDFERTEKGNKKWDSILKDAAKALRQKIKTNIRLGKIIVSYTHLNKLSKEVLPAERVFNFTSSYGSKSLPLDGLFIDAPAEERDGQIKAWALELVEAYAGKTGFSFEEYENAGAISRTLIKAYHAEDEIDKRFRLSELTLKTIKGNKTPLEHEELLQLIEHFGVTEAKIEQAREKKGAESSNLGKRSVDYREMKTGKHQVDRLIVLFSDLRLHKVYQDFCRTAPRDENVLYTYNEDVLYTNNILDRPTYKELRVVLFPIPLNPLVLPYHEMYLPKEYRKKDPFEVWDNHLTKNVMKENCLLPKTEFPANLSSVEKTICLGFSKEIRLDHEYFPGWLL